jgi:hypothetical protein
MIGISAKITERPPSAEKIIKNINFGLAVGLTKTAKEGQAAVIGALKGAFTLRGTWYQHGNRFGIKIQPAKPTNLEAAVQTRADWLLPHEEGKDKEPRSGQHLAVPTDQVRRNKRLIIPRGQRPKGLGSKVFMLQTRHGPVLAQRLKRGKRKGIVVLYGLERKVRIRKRPTFYPPIQKVVQRRLNFNVQREVEKALRTMR